MNGKRTTARDGWNWLMRDRASGRIVISQPPNPPMLTFVGSSVLRWLLPSGTLSEAARGVGTVAITWWAVDEVLRGSTPLRRLLGAGALLGIGAVTLRRR